MSEVKLSCIKDLKMLEDLFFDYNLENFVQQQDDFIVKFYVDKIFILLVYLVEMNEDKELEELGLIVFN